ncbi:MAG TPA: RNA polymerase sigma factor [Methylomirabilota bacterium]|nr:RNA polymerase sigma factor [Methylomirabilota bacterium]
MKGLLSTLFGLTDEQAMWRVQTSDDSAAFEHLVRKWQGPIQRLCTRMTGSLHKGEDLAQEVFARLHARREAYQPIGKFSTYLWRMALNVSYDELRRVRRRPEGSLIDADDESGDVLERNLVEERTPSDCAAATEAADRVQAALAALPEHYRVVIVMRHYEGLKFQEIAEVLGIPEGTVKSRMAYGLKQLHSVLAPEFGPRGARSRTPESLVL